MMMGVSPFVLKYALSSLSAGSVVVAPLIYSVQADQAEQRRLLSPSVGEATLINSELSYIHLKNRSNLEGRSILKEDQKLDVSKFIEKNTGMIQPNWELLTRSEDFPETFLKEDFKLLQTNEFREIQLEQDIEKSDDYRRFIANLILIVSNAIWTNTPVQGLWIDQVNLTVPKEEWEKASATLEREKSEGSLKTLKTASTDRGINSEVEEVVGMAIPSQSLKKSLREDSWTPLDQIDRNLKMMANLVYFFTNRNWNLIEKEGTPKSLNRTQLKGSDFVLSDIQLRTFSVSTAPQTGYIGEPVRHVIRLVRAHKGKYYHCDIFFNGVRQQDMIRVNFVKDSKGGRITRLQANGAYGTSGEHIGGDPKYAQIWERQYNSMDREFANLLVNEESRSKKVYKWFEVISRCVEQRECRELFHEDSHPSWSQRQSSSRSRDYGGVNPFSKIYNTVNAELNQKELSLFAIKSF